MGKTRGFLLGKFMPLHEGHIFLIDTASALVDELTVLVCTRQCEPIDGALRLQWVQQSVGRNVRVVHLTQDIPQEPSEHPNFWEIWARTIKAIHPNPIDTVFGSEAYITKLAAVLNATPFVLDQERSIIPVSASMIRQSPQENWHYIPKQVRPYYQKHLCILGPESTGKSYLSKILAQAYNTLYIPEYGRTYDAQFRQGTNWQVDDFVNIAKGHIALRNEISKRANHVCFEDTDLLQTIVWAEYILGTVPKTLQEMMQIMHPASHYLLLEPDIEWIDDGTRYSGDNTVRYWFFEQLQRYLDKYQLPYEIINGQDWDKRTSSVMNTVAEIL